MGEWDVGARDELEMVGRLMDAECFMARSTDVLAAVIFLLCATSMRMVEILGFDNQALLFVFVCL